MLNNIGRLHKVEEFVGCFAHPNLPHILSVGVDGRVQEISAFDGALCSSGVLALPATDPLVGGVALVVGRGIGILASFGHNSTVATYDIFSAKSLCARSLKADKLKGSVTAAICGSRASCNGDDVGPIGGFIFVSRVGSGSVLAVSLWPFGSTTENVFEGTVTALCCHPDRPWVAAGSSGVIRVLDYAGLRGEARGPRVEAKEARDDAEEPLKGKFACIAVCTMPTRFEVNPYMVNVS
jgi:hypothetical protein